MAGFDDDELLGKAYDAHLMRRLFGFIKPYQGQVVVALVLLLGAALVDLAPPLLIARAIDGPIAARNVPGILPIFALFIVVLIMSFVLRYGQVYLMQRIGQRVMVDLRMALFSHIQRMSLSFFDRNPVGRLITRITNDVDALNEFLTQGFVLILGDFVTLIGIIVIMFIKNWRLALLSVAVLPFVVITSAVFQRVMRQTYRIIRQRLARINAYLNEQLTGVLVVQLFNREPVSKAHFEEMSESYRSANMRSLFAFALFFPTIGFLLAVGTALLLYWGGRGVLAGWTTLGILVAFLQYLERSFQPIRNLAERYNILQSAMAASERTFWVLDTPEDVHDLSQPAKLPSHVQGEVVFDHVVFGYNPDELVLRDVSFTIPAGQAVAVVGATGAGKTSLISLLARFYDIQGGHITLDGIDISTVAQSDLRRHVAAVPQDPVCFSGTIASNIRLHEPNITDAEIRRAAEIANAAPFIERLPGQYEYEVRERGSNLSVGQRQLIAFARAIAFNPDVLLVLDEATSSVDTETEAMIQTALERLIHGRTSIVIAHRLSTIRHVDRIIVLDKGKVVEDGTHEELLARHGFYHRLYQMQYVGQQRSLVD
ncbi:MAG: ABC transporter ATP-binding protein [Herpetosiphonaceae bacterium]|nr:ABC transporter ATP-binding protein [Herpetosiphonaceae bacterium]